MTLLQLQKNTCLNSVSYASQTYVGKPFTVFVHCESKNETPTSCG